VVQWCQPDTYVPDCFLERDLAQLYRLPSFMELAYLHPDIFEPDLTLTNELGKGYTLLRFVSHSALHDFGSRDTAFEFKQKMIDTLESFGPVWISSETELPEPLKKYNIQMPAGKIHHAIAGASLVMGESATMCTEAAVLGVPSIHIHKNRWGYIKELEEEYGLVRHFSDRGSGPAEALSAAAGILQNEHIQEEMRVRRQRLLSEKKNMSGLMIRIVDEAMDHIRSSTHR
jgi:predicted glycosyltransferase